MELMADGTGKRRQAPPSSGAGEEINLLGQSHKSFSCLLLVRCECNCNRHQSPCTHRFVRHCSLSAFVCCCGDRSVSSVRRGCGTSASRQGVFFQQALQKPWNVNSTLAIAQMRPQKGAINGKEQTDFLGIGGCVWISCPCFLFVSVQYTFHRR